MVTGQLIFQPLKFDWHSEDQHTAFDKWKGHITPTLEASKIPKERWYASIFGFLGQEGFRQWQHLDISKDNTKKKDPDEVFKVFTKTLEVSTSHWNHINVMYSDIRQGEHKTTDQLDQCIKILVEKCGYMEAKEKMTHWKELFFHTTKHFKIKKWVRSQTAKKETVTFDKLLQYAKEHKATVRDFNQHKSNRGVTMATTIDEIRSFKFRKGNGQRAKSGPGEACSKCGMSHPPRECPAWGKKCHKCGNKNHFSTCCRSKQSGDGNRRSWSRSKGCKGKGKPSCSRSRSKPVTKSAHSIESDSFQDHWDDLHGDDPDDLHGESADPHGGQQENLHGVNSFQDHQESTDFVKKTFATIYRSKSVASICNDTDPEGKTKILMILQIMLPHQNGIDDIKVKVHDGAEGNILPLHSFRTMFPHALDVNSYQNQDSWEDPRQLLNATMMGSW